MFKYVRIGFFITILLSKYGSTDTIGFIILNMLRKES